MSITATPNVYEFDVRGVSKRFRHAAIFGALESMEQGEVMRFINDHNPLPLLNQLDQRYDGQVQHTYIQNNDEVVVIDFSIHPKQVFEEKSMQDKPVEVATPSSGGGCGGGGGGCGCRGN